ncbi:MAG: hypothetical protein ACOH5I_19025 [Oligoflexus sp.]
MRKTWTKLIMLAVLGMTYPALAHEGDHGPAQMEAPHGGVIRPLETIHLELVAESRKFKLYLYDKDGKPTDTAKIPLTASLTRPRQKAEALPVERKANHWEGTFDPKGAHRVTITFEVEQGGHKDEVEYTIEPKG